MTFSLPWRCSTTELSGRSPGRQGSEAGMSLASPFLPPTRSACVRRPLPGCSPSPSEGRANVAAPSLECRTSKPTRRVRGDVPHSSGRRAGSRDTQHVGAGNGACPGIWCSYPVGRPGIEKHAVDWGRSAARAGQERPWTSTRRASTATRSRSTRWICCSATAASDPVHDRPLTAVNRGPATPDRGAFCVHGLRSVPDPRRALPTTSGRGPRSPSRPPDQHPIAEPERRSPAHPFRRPISSSLSVSETASAESRIVSGRVDPGIGITTGASASSQANATR